MSKYNLEYKMKIVKKYEEGLGGYDVLSEKHHIPESTIKNWITWYKANGIQGLAKKMNHKTYTSDFKLKVITYRYQTQSSLRETAEHFKLSNGAMVLQWEKQYKSKGIAGLESKRGRPPKMPKKKVESFTADNNPLTETERQELIRLRKENMYLEAAILYEKKLQALFKEKNKAKAKKKQK